MTDSELKHSNTEIPPIINNSDLRRSIVLHESEDPTTSNCKVSIAMATRDGGNFLAEQLCSLGSQSRPPNELVVVDDGSRDETVSLLQAFAESAPFDVRLQLHEEASGPAVAFSRAVAACSGDVIFFCDQDDYWLSDKILIMVDILLQSNAVAALCNAELVNEDLSPAGLTLWKRAGFTRRMQERVRQGHAFEVFLGRGPAFGNTLAFRGSLRDGLPPIPAEWGHDVWTVLFASLRGHIELLDTPLVKYRQHARQVVPFRVGRPREPDRDRRPDFRKGTEDVKRLILALDEVPARPDAIASARDKLRHLEVLSALPANRLRRLPYLSREVASLRYWRFGYGIKDVAKDLAMP